MDECFRFVDSVCDRDKALGDLCRTQDGKNPLNQANRKAGDAAAAVEAVRMKRERLYEDYANGILTADDYNYMKEAYMEQATEAGAKLADALKEKHELEQRLTDFHKRTSELAGFRKDRSFNKDLVEKLVERIEVGRDKNIRIVFKFKDVFEEAVENKAGEEA